MTDWRLLVLITVVTFGAWGFLAKLAGAHLSWHALSFVIVMTNAVVMGAVTVTGLREPLTRWTAVAVLAGLLAAVGSLAMYRALSLAPASRVVPVTALYVLVTVLLSVLFLGERLSLTHWAGVALALVSIALLTR